MNTFAMRAGSCALAVAAAMVASSCTVLRPPGSWPPGTTIDEAQKSFGGPRARYALPEGGTRLEFDQGKQTYMLDFDPSGRLVASRQVLTNANLSTIGAGLSNAELLARFGHPAWVFGVGRRHLAVWNYRYVDADCVVYQVSVSDAGFVTEASHGMDPACDGGSRHR